MRNTLGTESRCFSFQPLKRCCYNLTYAYYLNRILNFVSGFLPILLDAKQFMAVEFESNACVYDFDICSQCLTLVRCSLAS